VPKQELHITDFSGGLNCYSDARDISDTQFSQCWNASLDKYGVVRFSGAGLPYVTTSASFVNNEFTPGGGLFSYSTDYIENIIDSDFNGAYFGGYADKGIAAYTRGATTITLDAVGPLDPRYSILQSDDSFNNMFLYITAGPGAGQTRKITDYAASGRTCTIDAAFGHSGQESGAASAVTIQAITGNNQTLNSVARIEVINGIEADLEGNAGTGWYERGDHALCGTANYFKNNENEFTGSTLKITDGAGKTVQCHFVHSNFIADDRFTFSGYSSGSNVKELDNDYVNLSTNIFTPGDRHYIIKANIAAADVIDYLVLAIDDANADNKCDVDATDANPVLILEDQIGGEGQAKVEYIGFFQNNVNNYKHNINPYNPDKSLIIHQPFTKGLGSLSTNTIAKVQADGHSLNVGEYVSITGGSYAGTHRVEWVFDDYFYIKSTVGTDDTTDRTFDTIPTNSSFFKIYNWNPSKKYGSVMTVDDLTRPGSHTAWQANQKHNNVTGTASANGAGLIASIETDGSGHTTFTILEGGSGYVADETISFTDPGSTSNTAVLTVASVSGTWSFSTDSSKLFSNVHHGTDNSVANAIHLKEEITSPTISDAGTTYNNYFQNTFICASGEAGSSSTSDNTCVDLGYIEQTGLDLRPGESYELSFEVNCLTSFKMWTADGSVADILPGVLLYSPTAGDGSGQDYCLMSDDNWVRSNEPVTNGGLSPFDNIVVNGDFKADAGSTYDDQGNPTITGWTIVRGNASGSVTSNEPQVYSLHENTSGNHINYFPGGGYENSGSVVEFSGDGGKNGGTVLEFGSSEHMTTNLYYYNYIYQDLELDGNCWYDLYIKHAITHTWHESKNSYLKWDLQNQESTDTYLDNNEILHGTIKIQYNNAKTYPNSLSFRPMVFDHAQQRLHKSENRKSASENSGKFETSYFRFYVPPMSTESDARTIRLRIRGHYNYPGGTQATFLSAVSVKKSFPDLIHIANQYSSDANDYPTAPIMAISYGASAGGDNQLGIPSYNGYSYTNPFYNQWIKYKLNITIPEDAYDTRDYSLRFYAGKFGYTTALTNGVTSSNSPYPNQQAVCFDNIKLTQKASSRGQDVLLLSDSIKKATSLLWTSEDIIPAQTKVHKHIVGNDTWSKEFIAWKHGNADVVYNYTNGVLQISDSNFDTSNDNLFFNYYYDRPVFGNYDISGFITLEDTVNFIGNVSATEYKNNDLISIDLNGCHEDVWRGYIPTFPSIEDGGEMVPEGVTPPWTGWHYMHFDWQKSLNTEYTDDYGDISRDKFYTNIPVKYVLLNALDGQGSMKRFGPNSSAYDSTGGMMSYAEEFQPASTLKHVYNNPVYLPISGRKVQGLHMDGNGIYYIDQSGALDASSPVYGLSVTDYIMNYWFNSDWEINPLNHYMYPISMDGYDSFESPFKGGNSMNSALYYQKSIDIDNSLSNGEMGESFDYSSIGTPIPNPVGYKAGPLLAANMSFELMLVFVGHIMAEATGRDHDDKDAVARFLEDCPIPKIRASVIKLAKDIDVESSLLDDLFSNDIDLEDVENAHEVSSEILPKTAKTIRQKKLEGDDPLFSFEQSGTHHSNDETMVGHIPYKFQLNFNQNEEEPFTSEDNFILKLEILDPVNNINYLESHIGAIPKDSIHNSLDPPNIPHNLGYNFNSWKMNFYSPGDNAALFTDITGGDVRVNLDFKIPIDADGQQTIDTAESWTNRAFQVGVSSVNIFGEESIISIDESVIIGKDVKIKSNECPKLSFIVNERLSHNPSIKEIKIYLKDTESDIWFLQASLNTFKGTIKSSTSGKEFEYSTKLFTGANTADILFEIPEKHMLNFNEVDSYESQSLVNQEDAMKKSTLTCRYKTSVTCNNRLYVGNIKQDGKVYGDRMLKTPIDKYNIFPASNYIDAAIQDGDEITGLAYFKDRILQFKKRKVFVINVSGDYEYLEDTFENVGIDKQCQITTTPYGICWVNRAGCFIYDGEKLENLISNKIGTEAFQSNPVSIANNYWIVGQADSATSTRDLPSIGYIKSTQKLIIAGSVGNVADANSRIISTIPEGMQYDFQSKGWTFLHKKITAAGETGTIPTYQGFLSNFVNDQEGNILYYSVDAGSDNLNLNSIYKWDDSSTRTQDSGGIGDVFYLRTKDYDFGSPGIRKKIYKIYVTFKTSDDTDGSDGYQDSKVNLYYNVNGTPPVSGTASALTFSDSTSTNYSAAKGLYASDSSTGWNVAELKPSAAINNVYSFQLLFVNAASRIANNFSINDITIVYRVKNIK
jgi:hypothetical protein